MDVAPCEMKKIFNDTQNVLTENLVFHQHLVYVLFQASMYIERRQLFCDIQDLSQSLTVKIRQQRELGNNDSTSLIQGQVLLSTSFLHSLFHMPTLYADFINCKANVITLRDSLKNKKDMEFSYPKRATIEKINHFQSVFTYIHILII